jgi:hypothetical protein
MGAGIQGAHQGPLLSADALQIQLQRGIHVCSAQQAQQAQQA